jgi:hypothetical protein
VLYQRLAYYNMQWYAGSPQDFNNNRLNHLKGVSLEEVVVVREYQMFSRMSYQGCHRIEILSFS